MSKTGAKILLTTVFIARGTSFLFSKILMESMSPMSILAIRFILAFLVLAVIFFKKLRECSKESLKGGLILGVLYTVCMIVQPLPAASPDLQNVLRDSAHISRHSIALTILPFLWYGLR